MESRATLNSKKFLLEVDLIPAGTSVNPSGDVTLSFISGAKECLVSFYADGTSDGMLIPDRSDPEACAEFIPARNGRTIKDFINGEPTECIG